MIQNLYQIFTLIIIIFITIKYFRQQKSSSSSATSTNDDCVKIKENCSNKNNNNKRINNNYELYNSSLWLNDCLKWFYYDLDTVYKINESLLNSFSSLSEKVCSFFSFKKLLTEFSF